MAMTKVFMSGNSQAVRIPREFQIDTDVIEIVKVGNDLVLRKPETNLTKAYHALRNMPADFFKGGRRQGKAQKRTGL